MRLHTQPAPPSKPALLAGREVGPVTPEQVFVDVALGAADMDLATRQQPFAGIDADHLDAVITQRRVVVAIVRVFGSKLVQPVLEGAAPALAVALGQPADGDPDGVFMAAGAQRQHLGGAGAGWLGHRRRWSVTMAQDCARAG